MRAAYVVFPECRIISSDRFVGAEPIEPDINLSFEDKIDMMANGVKFRHKQLHGHIVEHTDGMNPEESEYYKNTNSLHLYRSNFTRIRSALHSIRIILT